MAASLILGANPIVAAKIAAVVSESLFTPNWTRPTLETRNRCAGPWSTILL
jgi:hypothetical protein